MTNEHKQPENKPEAESSEEVVTAFDGPMPFNLKSWIRKRQSRQEPDFEGLIAGFRKVYEQLWGTPLLQKDPEARALLLRVAQAPTLEDLDSEMTLLVERGNILLQEYLARKATYDAEAQQGQEGTQQAQKTGAPAPSPTALTPPQPQSTVQEQRRLHTKLDGSGGRSKFNVEGDEDEEGEEDRSFIRM